MRAESWTALRMTLVTLVLTGFLYPVGVTVAAKLFFPDQADGSMAVNDRSQTVGSLLIAQAFHHPGYFQPRPSAAGEQGYDGNASGGSNLGPSSAKLRARVQSEIHRLQQENPDADAIIPLELVTTSGSGLDPDLSLAACLWQLPRVAKARHLSTERVRSVVQSVAEAAEFFGPDTPRVNVLKLNLALDQQFGPLLK